MRGFTLVEVLVSVLILGFLIAGIFGVLNIGNMTYNTDLGLLDLQQQARRAMDGMIRELRQTNEESGEGNLNIVSSSEITFGIPPETYGDAWIGPIRYSLDTDERQIIREYPAGTQRILANDIESLNFSLSGNIVEIDLAAKKTALRRELCFPNPCGDPMRILKEQVRLRRNE